MNPAILPVAPRGLSLKVAPTRDRREPYRFTVSGALKLPSAVAQADGCSGTVAITAKVRRKRVARRSATVGGDCRFKTRITSRRKGRVTVTAAFAGNARLTALSARPVKTKAG
jgi:hypothetical protein